MISTFTVVSESDPITYTMFDFLLIPMSGSIEPYDWFKRFFNDRNWFGERDLGSEDFFGMNIFRDFNEIQSQMQRMFDQFDNNLASGPSKDFVREYQGPDGSKVRQVGPIVY